MSELPKTPPAIRVIAPARLHLGFLDLNGSLGRRFGGIGLAIDEPRTDIVVTRARNPGASGPEADRALAAVQRYAKAFRIAPHYRVEVGSAIPSHAGLGSGTQLALAVGAALARLEGLPPASARMLGEIHERGARSAIGIAAFERGGFIVDGGKPERGAAPPVLMRADFPSSWRALLVTDARSEGVHGEGELAAFARLPPFSDQSAGELCRLVLMQLMPGVVEQDLTAFGAALTRIQEILGAHFAAAQGGSPWTSPDVGRLVAALGRAGAVGLGQSSWGPTGFAFVESAAAAERLYSSFVQDAKAKGLQIAIVAGRNQPATVEVCAPADAKA